MFEEWKECRRLRKEIADLERQKIDLETDFVPEYKGDTPNSSAWKTVNFKIRNRTRELAAIETDKLKHKATRLGIEFPKDKSSWFWDDIDDEGEKFRAYFTEAGKAGISKLIKEEKRKSIEWHVKIISSVITLLTGLVGAVIGVIAILKQ